ncbi:hypothetical protein NQ315_003277 [Exocentrus adspersus]|uniref:Uncharacterized protein n=1 Tax=Exocentrus adspersus TaxID=1586481 RepID=A0AAV8VCI9_9CUCU|nr:hypothetical protein NQ315_003277 [Exocentrus adspersus]
MCILPNTGDDEIASNIADHVLVFMLKGITKSWKQPIVYSFCKSSTKTIDLVRLLKIIITECQQTGLRILATVSDQGATNCAAINYLTKYNSVGDHFSNDLKIYQVNKQKNIHIYDPPHLLKGIRNNLINKHLIWNKNGVLHTAKWDHIINVYKFDNASGNLRLLPKLTDSHVIPEKLKKMKVSYASQIFSHYVASVMQLLSSVKGFTSYIQCFSYSGLDKSATETAEILSFFDKLFDSVNGYALLSSHGKELKCAATVQNFKQFYKTLLLNNFVTRHSLSANCETDNSVNIISSVKRFETQGVPEETEYTTQEFDALLLNINISEMPLTYVDTISVGYFSHLQNVNTLKSWKEQLLSILLLYVVIIGQKA